MSDKFLMSYPNVRVSDPNFFLSKNMIHKRFCFVKVPKDPSFTANRNNVSDRCSGGVEG